MTKTHPHLYAVYDADNRLIKTYVYASWARRKAEQHAGSRVESYVHEGNRFGVEMAHFMNRERIE